MAQATEEEKAELREMLPALEEEAEDAALTHREGNTEGNKAWLADVSAKLRYARWRLRGGDPDTDHRAPYNPFQDQE